MREALGSSLMLYLIIPIIIMLIIFVAFIMNYASAYRAANYVVTQIENCQGELGNCSEINLDTITETVRTKYKYITEGRKPIPVCYFNNGGGYVFRVTLSVSFELPFIDFLPVMNVVSETKTITNQISSKAMSQFKACS